MDTQIIEFLTMDNKFIGRATVKDGVLSGSTDEVTSLIDSFPDSADKAAKFVENFSQWTNGYMQSELVEA